MNDRDFIVRISNELMAEDIHVPILERRLSREGLTLSDVRFEERNDDGYTYVVKV